MIATLGSQVTVRLYPTLKARGSGDFTEVQAVISSAGPPGVIGDWARTLDQPQRWLLIRKGKNVPYEAFENDPGI